MNDGKAGLTDGVFRLDDLSLEHHAKLYPDEMREPFMWFGYFVRDICGRDLEVLMTRLDELGINHDKTNWSKILRGRWNRDAEGNLVSNPCIALPKFIKAVQLLREDQQRVELAGKVPFVETTTAQMIFDFINARRSPERVNRFGIIASYTGSQATSSLKEYQRKHNHGACVWLEAPENGSAKEFIVMLSAKYGGSWSDSYTGARNRVFKTVKSRNTIMVDNAQTLYKASRGSDQPVFALLRRLQDEKGCTVILKVTYDFAEKLKTEMLKGFFEQFEGRAGGRRNFLVLPEYPPDEDVLAIAQAFKLKDAEKHLPYLSKIAHEPGRIRILFEDLQSAKMTAEAEGKQLTVAHIKAARGED